jgi:thioesterase domain-containing protein
MHPVGGTLLCYRELVAALPGGGPIVGCERLPGAHPVEESLEELADRHAATLCHGTPDGPVTVAGWSVGGVVAHAVAGRLLARGREVAGLVLIDSLMPRTAADRDAVRASASRLREAVRDPDRPAAATLLRQYGLAPDLLAGTAGEQLGEPSVTGVQPGRQAGAGRPAGTGAPAGPGGQVGEVVADWGRLLELVAAYRGGAVAVPGLLVVAGGNPGELPRRIEASWAGLCAGLRVREVGGDHLSVLRWPAVREVAEAMSGG